MSWVTAAVIGGGALLGAMGGSKKGNTTTVQSNDPWSGVQPYLSDLYSRGQDASIYGGYKGPMLAPGAVSQLGNTIRGDYLDPSKNQFLQPYVRDALGLAGSDFMGRYGGAAGSNIGNSGFQEMLARTLGNTALPIYANAYGQERQNQLQASQLAPSVDTANMQAPFAPFQAYSNLLQSGANYGTSTTQSPYFTNPFAGAMGGGLSAGALYGMMGGYGGGGGLIG